MSPRGDRAVEWATEWFEYRDESLAELLERFAMLEISVWRLDNMTPGGGYAAAQSDAGAREEREKDGPLLTCPWCGIALTEKITAAQTRHLIECGDRSRAQLAAAEQAVRELAATCRKVIAEREALTGELRLALAMDARSRWQRDKAVRQLFETREVLREIKSLSKTISASLWSSTERRVFEIAAEALR
jgi:hypothetical protein